MNILKFLVVLSIYDGGCLMSFMENGKVEYIDTYKQEQQFIKRFGRKPEDISIYDLSKHYSSEYIIVKCVDGDIMSVEGSKK